MEIDFNATVVDKNGKRLGTVDHIVRDSWSGGIRKFVVRQKDLGNELFLSPDDVAKATNKQVILKLSLEELNRR
jgi:sporulation protein YlmC with PRC-barrel domain